MKSIKGIAHLREAYTLLTNKIYSIDIAKTKAAEALQKFIDANTPKP